MRTMGKCLWIKNLYVQNIRLYKLTLNNNSSLEGEIHQNIKNGMSVW